jgi:hypothetical protein
MTIIKLKTFNNQKYWYIEEEQVLLCHRVGGPAVFYDDGEIRWMQYGRIHREDGPAMIFPDGVEVWYREGKRIRDKVAI